MRVRLPVLPSALSYPTTSMPYICYIDLADWLWQMYNHLRDALNAYFVGHTSVDSRSAKDFQSFCADSSSYSDVFVCDGYRLCCSQVVDGSWLR